jgi:hypothetical protein
MPASDKPPCEKPALREPLFEEATSEKAASDERASAEKAASSKPAFEMPAFGEPPSGKPPFDQPVFDQAPSGKPTSRPELVEGKEVVHWSRLPIWGAKEARECGFELPLPLGLCGNVFSQRANFHVPKVTVGGRGGGLLDIGGLIRVGNVKIEETAWTSRLDAWILPFLDLYAVGGYVEGKADIELRPGFLPILRSRGPKFNLKLEYGGPTVGLGGTLAGGFKPFKDRQTTVFGLTDLNFTRTFLNFKNVVSSLPGVDVTVFSTRLGVRERILEHSPFGEVHASLWGGGMWQGVQEVMAGSVFHAVNFRANVEAVNPWNTIVGGRLELGKNAVVTVEVGLGDRTSLMLEAAIRF